MKPVDVLIRRIAHEWRRLCEIGVTDERLFLAREDVGLLVWENRVYDVRSALPLEFFRRVCADADRPATRDELARAIRRYVR